MSREKTKEILEIIKSLSSMDYVDPELIPNIDLYMDQVTTFMDTNLADSKRSEDDKILTKTMINNYTKNDLLPPPYKKKYSNEHLYLLIFIYYLKNMFSINDIKQVITPLTNMFYENENAGYSLEEIYRGIVNLEEEHSKEVFSDILVRFKNSKRVFETTGDDEQDEILSRFAFICMLSYDVYMKKSLLDRMIDVVLTDENAAAAKKKAEEKES